MKARIDGAWRDVSEGRIRINGQWRTITGAQAYIGGTWREIASFIQPLSVSIDPPEVSGFTVGEGTVQSRGATAVPSGGATPYTYSWARVGGGEGFADSPNAATTTFSRFVALGQEALETFRVTVTSAGQTATADIPVTFSSIDLGL